MDKNNFYTNLKSHINGEFLDLFSFDLSVKNSRYSDHFKPNKQFYNNYKFLLKQIFIKVKKGLSINNSNNKIAHSNAYFDLGKNDESDYTFIKLPWNEINNIPLFFKLIKFRSRIERLSTRDLILNEYLEEFRLIENQLINYYNNYPRSIVCLSNDLHFYERLTLRITKKLKIPSFLFNHGLPAIYDLETDNRTDYRVVWGNAIKRNYINVGFEENKIFVSGHPIYSKLKRSEIKLRSSLDNVLIITKNLWWGTPFSRNIYSERSELLNYLLQVEIALKELGVKKVRLRVHPSENISWYLQNLNNQFYLPDKTSNLKTSLDVSTLVIGPTSTVLIDSFFHNVNFIVFEPRDNRDLDYSGLPLVPPFDGSEKRIRVANNIDELKNNIMNNSLISEEFINDYIHPNYQIDFLNVIK